jgi:hypothetical protein
MTRLAVGYVIYLLASAGVTVCVGRTLHRHGRLFLIDVFHGDVSLAAPVNHLLLVGFYLVNVAFVLLMLRTRSPLMDDLAIATFVADKLGTVLTTLGAMHFVNVAVLLGARRRLGVEGPRERHCVARGST